MGVGVWYSLFIKKLPIIHLIKNFAYSLIPHCLFPTPVPGLRPLGWFFTHWLTNSLND